MIGLERMMELRSVSSYMDLLREAPAPTGVAIQQQ
jgi:hypothetical protein